MGQDYKVYYQEKLTFIIFPDKILIRTHLGQQFYLSPKTHQWSRKLRVIRLMVELNEIRTLEELASWTNPGIEWMSTTRHLDIENLRQTEYA